MTNCIFSIALFAYSGIFTSPNVPEASDRYSQEMWYTAGLVVETKIYSYGPKIDQWLIFDWGWNLQGSGGTLDERLAESQEVLDDLWAVVDSSAHSTQPIPNDQRARVLERIRFLDVDEDREFDLKVQIKNGAEVIDVPSVHIGDESLVWEFPHYDSRILMEYKPDGALVGEWVKQRGENQAKLFFISYQDQRSDKHTWAGLATRLFRPDFDVKDNRSLRRTKWDVVFSESGRSIAEFTYSFSHTMSHRDLTFGILENHMYFTGFIDGTFLTPTGDFRFLSGDLTGTTDGSDGTITNMDVSLSTFDGAHAFLFKAKMQQDGSLVGQFWSGNWHHETWTAVRDDDAKLPDAFGQTVIADVDALGDMVFKNLDGEPTRVLDLFEDTGAKARIIEVFGTWCPNCSDAGRELVSLKEQYGDDLAVVGLAFEITEDFDRSVTQVRRHHEHIGTDWPILIAGLSDKDKASVVLPVLDKVRSYPTLIFLNAANEVQAVYTGFTGPATGETYTEQRHRFEELIDGMIED